MLLRTNEEVVTIYVVNYTLLMAWGISSVMVEATVGAEREFTSNFSAYLALAIGIFCALAHILFALFNRLRRQRSQAAIVRCCRPLT
jgi:hypothetical protein